MALLRSVLSPLLVATLLLATEGVMVSLHICCGGVEAIGVYTHAESCCCEGPSTADAACSIAESSDCCQTSDAYMLLPVGAVRTHNTHHALVSPAWAVLPVAHIQALGHSSSDALLGNAPRTEHCAADPSPPLLQIFRL